MDAHGETGAEDHGDGGFGVTDLAAAGIEHDDEEQTGGPSGDGSDDEFRRDHERVSRAVMRIGQMPLAAGTGGHQVVGDREAKTR